MSRPTRTAALCVLSALALAGCSAGPVRSGAAATVGDSRITTEQLAQYVESGLADPAAEALKDDRAKYQRDVLGRLLAGDVVAATAAREGVTVTAGQVDAQYASLRDALGGDDALRDQAAAAGLSLDRVRDLARTRALTEALGDKLTQGVEVPQDQLRAAYQDKIDTYDQVRTAQVLLPTLADAQALLPQAAPLTDAQFADLARQRSTDASSRDDGGDLGLAPRSAFEQAGLTDYAAAAFAAKVGDTFAVASPRGGHVVRVLERRTTTFEQAEPELRREALQQQSQQLVDDALARTARELDIHVNPRFGTWDPATLQVVERPVSGPGVVSSPEAGEGTAAEPS